MIDLAQATMNAAFPDMRGWSTRNLKYMAFFGRATAALNPALPLSAREDALKQPGTTTPSAPPCPRHS